MGPPDLYYASHLVRKFEADPQCWAELHLDASGHEALGGDPPREAGLSLTRRTAPGPEGVAYRYQSVHVDLSPDELEALGRACLEGAARMRDGTPVKMDRRR